MKLPDPIVVETQGMVFRVSTIAIMSWDILVSALTSTERTA